MPSKDKEPFINQVRVFLAFYIPCTYPCELGVLVSRQISKIEEGKVKHSQLSSMALSLSQEDISCLQTELPKFLKFWVLNFPPNHIQVYASCKLLIR